MRRSRIESCSAIELSGLRTSWARPEALRFPKILIGLPRLLEEAGVLEGHGCLRGQRLGHLHGVLRPAVVFRAAQQEQAEQVFARGQRHDESRPDLPPLGERRVHARIAAPVRDVVDLAFANGRRNETRPGGDQVERAAGHEVRVRLPRDVAHADRLRPVADKDHRAVGANEVTSRLGHGPDDGLDVQRAADGLAHRGHRARLLVAHALGLQVAGALDGQADLMAQRFQETQLVLREELSGASGHVEHTARSLVEAQRNAGMGDGGAQALDDVRHAGTLRRVARLHAMAAPEHLGTQALPEAFSPDLLHVALRDAARGGEGELPLLVRAHEDPGRLEVHPLEDLVERDVEDGLDLVLAVDARGHLGEDGQLALPLEDRVAQGAHTVLVGRLHSIELISVRHREIILAPDYARCSPTICG